MKLKGGAVKMIEPLRSRRKLLKIGNSKYVLIPAYWQYTKRDAVIVEVFDNKVVITPAR